MAETNSAATPAIDVAAITKAASDALMAAIKPQLEQIGGEVTKLSGLVAAQQPAADASKGTPAAAAAGTPSAAAPITLKDVADLLDKRDAQRQQSNQVTTQREAFIGSKLKNFPAAYQAKLGNDPAKWDAEATEIENAFKADAQKFGWKIPNVGGDNPGGTAVTSVRPDMSKLSPTQLIEAGLKQESAQAQTAK